MQSCRVHMKHEPVFLFWPDLKEAYFSFQNGLHVFFFREGSVIIFQDLALLDTSGLESVDEEIALPPYPNYSDPK